jgi:hypothetical protein
MRRLLTVLLILPPLSFPALAPAAETLRIAPPPTPAAETSVPIVVSGENAAGVISEVELYALPIASTCPTIYEILELRYEALDDAFGGGQSVANSRDTTQPEATQTPVDTAFPHRAT